MGRHPQPVPQQKADEIISWISEGKTLREFCRQEGNPVYSTVYEWAEKDPTFAARFAHARLIGEEVIAQQCLAIADTPMLGQIVTEKPDGTVEVKTADMTEHRKLQIYTRLQLLAKWNPKKWGENRRVELGLDSELADRLLAAKERVKCIEGK